MNVCSMTLEQAQGLVAARDFFPSDNQTARGLLAAANTIISLTQALDLKDRALDQADAEIERLKTLLENAQVELSDMRAGR